MTSKGAVKPRRRIKGLIWAELRPEGPFPKTRTRKAAFRKGLTYEKKVGRMLDQMVNVGELEGELVLKQWILFADSNGIGWAQPDAYLVMKERILLVECKLTQSDEATPQMISLYLPLLRKIYDTPILCLQVCKNLRYVPKKFVESPQELLERPGPGAYTWQCLT